jgi:hypothetical protein
LPEGRQFARADHLTVGDGLLGADGALVVVESVTVRGVASQPMVNLTVAVTHTFYAGVTPVLVHNCGTADEALPGLPDSAPKPAGRGSTGRTEPQNLNEQLAMEEVRSAPRADGATVIVEDLGDPRWKGWEKVTQNPNGIEIHYVREKGTGLVDDFKFADQG